MISNKRREIFVDLYRLAEFYENPPFKPGDIEGNAKWFEDATVAILTPFLKKHEADPLALDLALAVVDDASQRAAALNQETAVL